MKEYIKKELSSMENNLVSNRTGRGPSAASLEKAAQLASILKDLEIAEFYSRQTIGEPK